MYWQLFCSFWIILILGKACKIFSAGICVTMNPHFDSNRMLGQYKDHDSLSFKWGL